MAEETPQINPARKFFEDSLKNIKEKISPAFQCNYNGVLVIDENVSYAYALYRRIWAIIEAAYTVKNPSFHPAHLPNEYCPICHLLGLLAQTIREYVPPPNLTNLIVTANSVIKFFKIWDQMENTRCPIHDDDKFVDSKCCCKDIEDVRASMAEHRDLILEQIERCKWMNEEEYVRKFLMNEVLEEILFPSENFKRYVFDKINEKFKKEVP